MKVFYTDIDVNTEGMIHAMFEQPIEINCTQEYRSRKDVLTLEIGVCKHVNMEVT